MPTGRGGRLRGRPGWLHDIITTPGAPRVLAAGTRGRRGRGSRGPRGGGDTRGAAAAAKSAEADVGAPSVDTHNTTTSGEGESKVEEDAEPKKKRGRPRIHPVKVRGGRRGRRPKNRFPPAPIETREVTINEADNKQTEVETLDDTLSGDEELEKTQPKSPEKTPNPAPFPPTTTEAPTKTKPATETPKSTKNTGKGGGTSGCARATFRSTSTKSISMDELDEHLSNKRPVGIGLTGPLPAMAPFAPPHPGVPFTPFVGVGNQAFNPFPAGFYGSGIPLPTTVP